jgi:hypothetical protein
MWLPRFARPGRVQVLSPTVRRIGDVTRAIRPTPPPPLTLSQSKGEPVDGRACPGLSIGSAAFSVW